MECDCVILGGDQFSGLQFEMRIDIESCRVFEELPQAAQQSTFALVVKAFVKNLFQMRGTQCDSYRPLGKTGEIGCQPVKPAKVGNQHGLTQCSQRFGTLQKICGIDNLVSG